MKRFILFALIALVLIAGIALAVNYSQTVEYALSVNYIAPFIRTVVHVLKVGFSLGKVIVLQLILGVGFKSSQIFYLNYILGLGFKLSQFMGLNLPLLLTLKIGPVPPQLEASLGVAVLCVDCLPAVRNITTTTTIGLGQPTYPVFSTQAINWFSIMGLLFLPCALLGVYAGPMGCVAGLGMGFTAGVLTGLIPVWAVLVIVIIIVGLLFARRERG